MELEKIAAVVRPRRSWEAVDLGFGMVQAWWPALSAAWLVTVVPVWLAVGFTLSAHPRTAVFVLWWLKPLFERIPLFVLSRALFGATPGVRETLRALPGLWRARTFQALTFGRGDPARSFLASVTLLEGLRGAAYRERTALLRPFDFATASWLTAICAGFEVVLFAGFLALVEMVVPEGLQPDLGEALGAFAEGRPERWFYVFCLVCAGFATAVIAPFYAAGGFALYLNRRTHLEGWDVEIAFRRLSRRLQRGGSRAAAAVLFAALLGGFLPAAPATAQAGSGQDPQVDPQQAVQEVLAGEDFGQRETRATWRPRYGKKRPTEAETEETFSVVPFAAAVGVLLRYLMIALGAVAGVSLLILVLKHAGHSLPGRLRQRTSVSPETAADIQAPDEPLPDDIVAAARESWRAGRFDTALGWLYRGALDALARRWHLQLDESWTEGDCVAYVEERSSAVAQGSAGKALAAYFARLTSVWQAVAYAHRRPSDAEMEEILAAWPGHFRRVP